MKPSLQQIADLVGVSAKTVSNALNGGEARMAVETRARIQATAAQLGYVPNVAARGMRLGSLPMFGIVADGVITTPFATDIMRAFDNAVRPHGLSVLVTNVGGRREVDGGVAELQQFMPRAIAYAAMYHKVVRLTDRTAVAVRLMVNCCDARGQVPAIVPAEAAAARDLVLHLFSKGRRRLAFLNLPGLHASELRAAGFRAAHADAGIARRKDWIRPATAGDTYTDRARSLVERHVRDLMAGQPAPDALVCGNDRVAMEAYNALRRAGVAIPGDVAVASFDNQVEIATRLDPPLTTMALPHREMGRRAADILLGRGGPSTALEELPFRLVERHST